MWEIIFEMSNWEKLFPTIILDSSTVRLIFLGIWLVSALYTFSFLPISYVLAFKDTSFSLFMGFVSWITGFLFIYASIEILHVSADYFWMLLTLLHFTIALFYYLRTTWLIKKLEPVPVHIN